MSNKHIPQFIVSQRFALLLVLGLAAALLGACSAVRIGYSQADTILAWTANSYFDLDSEQKADFDRRMQKLLAWHRYEQLPEYVQFFTALKQRTQRPLTRDDAIWLIEGVKERYRVVARHGTQDAAEMLATLTPENIRALEKEWERVNRKFEREYRLKGNLEDRKRARLERTIKQIRDWTGSLNHEQEERIAVLSSALPDSETLRHRDRLRRQKEFRSLLELRKNKAEFAPKLRQWLLDWEHGRTPEFEKTMNEVSEKRIALYLEVERMLTPQQRTHLQQKIQDYIDDMKALSVKRPAGA